jgi:hypothetical protein
MGGAGVHQPATEQAAAPAEGSYEAGYAAGYAAALADIQQAAAAEAQAGSHIGYDPYGQSPFQG